MIPGATWTEGYVTDISYTTNFYNHQVPDFLNFCCLLYGFKPLDLNKEFNYCELGCGVGFTSNIMASLYPHANFFAVDFMPQHIEFANMVKEEVGLNNISFMEVSFEELVKEKLDELPDFDIITLHGVFSWVGHKNRVNIVEFVSKKLKPGGILNVSYNNMCGWFMRVPFQKFIVDFSKLFPEMISIRKMEIIMKFAKKLQDAGALYFNMPGIKKAMEKTDEQAYNYLVHEYLNEDWQPLFFSEVLNYMQRAKLKYIGVADPVWVFEPIIFNKKQLEALNSFRSSYMREIAKDYILIMSFRKDIYLKGGQLLNRDLYRKMLEDVIISVRSPVEERPYKISVPYSQRTVNIDSKVINGIIDELNKKDLAIGEIATSPLLKDVEFSTLIRALVMLMHKRIIDPVMTRNSNNLKKSTTMNRFIASRSRYYNDLKFFVLPKVMSATHVDLFKRLVYDAMVNMGIKEIDDIIEHVKKYSDNMNLNWEAVDVDKDEMISKTVGECIEKDLPLWERTGAI